MQNMLVHKKMNGECNYLLSADHKKTKTLQKVFFSICI